METVVVLLISKYMRGTKHNLFYTRVVRVVLGVLIILFRATREIGLTCICVFLVRVVDSDI